MQGETGHRWPEILPGGKDVLFTIWAGGTREQARIGVLSLETGQWKTVLQGGVYPRYLPTGHLLYIRTNTLMAAPFDLTTLEVTGDSVPVLESVLTWSRGASHFAVSKDGMLVYLPGADSNYQQLVWVDREGIADPLPQEPRMFRNPKLSPAGQQIAVAINDPTSSSSWILDLRRNILRKTNLEGRSGVSIWSPDGSQMVVTAVTAPNVWNLYLIPSDGSGPAQQLTTADGSQVPCDPNATLDWPRH